jgi:hypothetical protein
MAKCAPAHRPLTGVPAIGWLADAGITGKAWFHRRNSRAMERMAAFMGAGGIYRYHHYAQAFCSADGVKKTL